MIYPDLPRLALSIRQPWAWAIANDGKPVENRDWLTNVRGPICIHASLNKDADKYGRAAAFMRSLGITPPARLDIRRGGIIATADLSDCVTQHDSPWFFGRYGFVLENVRPIDFIPVKGKLGFFEWRSRVIGVAA